MSLYQNINYKGNYAQFYANQTNLASIPRQASTSLSSPMVFRVHNVKPGCGSCGK
jgi:hypothetical protein